MDKPLYYQFDSSPHKDDKHEGLGKGKKQAEAQEISREMLEALKNGDHDAYNKIYVSYIVSLVKFLTALLHSKEDAEEIAQDIFMRIWEERDRIDPDKNIKGYIYTYARFFALKFLSHKKVENKYIDSKIYAPLEMADSTHDIVVCEETSLLIEISLSHMPNQQQNVFRMSRYEGLSNEEISQRLGLSKRTVETHLYKAVKELREIIALFLIFFMMH